MATGMDAVQEGGQRLPALHDGRGNLVSPRIGQQVQTPSPCEQAQAWAADVRKNIAMKLGQNEDVAEDDIRMLKQELISVIISTLQQDNRSSWAFLVEVLKLVEELRQYLNYLDSRAEFYHYLERLFHHLQKYRGRLFDLQVEHWLQRVFPEELEILKSKGSHPVKNYCSVPSFNNNRVAPCSTVPKPTVVQQRDDKAVRFFMPDGSNPYSLYIPSEEEILDVKHLTFGDLRKSIGNVAYEFSCRESIWNQSLGTTALALCTNIPEEPKGSPDKQFQDVNTCNSSPRFPTMKTPRTFPRKILKEDIPEMSGREAVQYFASCNHTGKIKSLYFNLAPSRHFSPYDLISVSKAKVNPEHYVFSSFGVLHVYPDQPSESMTLAEWQREAVLWKAVSSIPFFKQYLVTKMFHRWHCNKLYLDFLRRQMQIRDTLLHGVPTFGAALLQISRLLKELITVQFLPFETDKTYQLSEYENNINYKNIQAERILEKFFRYCKLVVDTTADESFKKMKYCEEQVKKKTFFSKDSLHLQKVKKEEREKNLLNAKKETGRLGNFVKLTDQMIVEHLFQITKCQVLMFVTSVLNIGTDAPRAGLFKANLVFNKQDKLCLSPSKEKFQRVLTNTLQGIPAVLCSRAIPMDGSLREAESQEDALPLQQEPKATSSNTHMDIKSLSASQISSRKHDSIIGGVSEHESQIADGALEISLAEQESEATSVSASQVLQDSFPVPELPHAYTPTKSEDDIGVATPDLVLTSRPYKGLAVEGEGFMGQYSPLTSASLEDKLSKDVEYQAALKLKQDLLQAALNEIDGYCEQNEWLNEIHVVCRSWNNHSVREFRGAAAFTIEQKLTELRQWSEKVRNFDRNFLSENGMFFVDCSAIHEGLLPQLSDIYQELVTFVADEAKSLAASFCEEMKIVLKNMKDKHESVESFALFAKNYSQYKKNSAQYQQRVEYIKSLYEVIRMSYRQLTTEEEKAEEAVCASWEAFLMQMHDASEFINTQTPLMTQQLEHTFQKLEKDARQLADLATSGRFLDPNENPLQVLGAMKELREKFFRTQLQLQEASQWREAISGEAYSLKFLNEMTVCMDVRQELWKYVEVSSHAIKDWKKMLFKKMNMKKALEKIIEWQSAAAQLKPHLPAGDAVLTAWYHSLQDFRKDLPVLHKLANDALKDRHWQSIFLGMNEPYAGNAHFTVADLLSYNLSDNSQLVHSVYLSAVQEYDLEQRIAQIKRFWQEKNFKLAKHIPDSMFANEPTKRVTSPSRRTTKLERYRQERAAAAAGMARGLDIMSDDFYILIETEELKYQLEDSRISVAAMLQSPYVGDILEEAQEWHNALREIEEITDLWENCQKKWLYLLKIFERPELFRKLTQQAFKFETIHNKFKDWMRVVSNDSKVLSVVNRRRGEKGYRLLQGDNLRALFLTLIYQQEEILKDLEQYLENYRAQFPRLYFLSNDDLVEMLGISRNPQALVPFVRKCFPGVTDLNFALPPGMGGLNSALDFALNSDKLQVFSVQGTHGEEVGLYTRLNVHDHATTWLHSLESILKNTMTVVLQSCVQARIEEGTCQPILILEELAQAGQEDREELLELTSEIRHKYQHWLLNFPAQCILVTECILWERGMGRILEKNDTDDLKMLRSNLNAKIDQYVDVMRESSASHGIEDNLKQRLSCLLISLITQNIHHRDIVDTLLNQSGLLNNSFDWLKVLKFRMDIRNVLRAKTTVNEARHAAASDKQPPPRKAPSISKQKEPDETNDDPAILTRAKTTVSTDFQFSPCYVQQLSSTLFYDYEYLGPAHSLVITPLTERAILSLTQSLKMFHCCTLVGPAGTGKTETIRHLARMLGRCMFTITCSENVTLPMMLQYMAGMVQTGCWALFDDTDRLTKGLMSVTAQQLDYLHTALRALDISSQNQYQIRGQPRFDKKTGAGDTVIRRNSLTTLHPLPHAETHVAPVLERQKTVPHGFNEKGLVTYFEDTWVAEREQRRHSIEREIKIKESDLYKNNRPPPLFYEHVKASRRHLAPDYSKLIPEPTYVHRLLGNIMFNGKLVPASANFGCFMTMGMSGANPINIPDNFRLLMRPCALIKPDTGHIISLFLQTYGFQDHALWSKKLALFLTLMETKLPRKSQYKCPLQEMKKVVILSAAKTQDQQFLHELPAYTSTEMDSKVAEEHCLVWALRQVLGTRVQPEDEANFIGLLHDIFPHTMGAQLKAERQDKEQPLLTTIHEVMKEDRLMENGQFIQKVLQVNSCLEAHSPVILIGAAGSGKSTCCQVLSRAINQLNYRLYAPDHSSDELTTDRNLVFQSTQKLKILRGAETSAVEPLLKDLDEELKTKASTGLKKLRQMKENLIVTKNLQTAAEEQQKCVQPQDVMEYPKVDVIRLVPTSMEPHELLGYFKDGVWEEGLLGKIVHDSFFISMANKGIFQALYNADKKEKKQQAERPSLLLRWLVLDGDLDPTWTDSMKTLFDEERRLSLASGTAIHLRETTSLIFETSSLCDASPSAVSRCAVVHFGSHTVQWNALYHTWKQTAKTRWLLTTGCLKILDDMVQDIFPATLKFLSSECCTAMLTDVDSSMVSASLSVTGVSEVSAFLKIFSALLDKVLLREELEKRIRWDNTEGLTGRGMTSDGVHSRQMASRLTNSSNVEAVIPHYMTLVKGIFAFAFVWSFGGHLHDRFKEKFSKFVHDVLYRSIHSIHIPAWGQVFDFYVDEVSGTFVRWNDKQHEKMKTLGGTFLLSPEVECYTYILDLLLSNHHAVLLTGAPGVGKSSLIQNVVLSKHASSTTPMSRGMSAAMLQRRLIGHIQEVQNRALGVVSGPGTSLGSMQAKQRHLFFIDDLNMAPTVGGYQPPVELLRHILSTGGTYDQQRQEFQKLQEAYFIAAATLPTVSGSGLGHAAQVLSSRVLRQFVNLTMFTPPLESLLSTFSQPLQTWLEEFPTYSIEHHYEFARALTLGLLELYAAVRERLRPTPTHAHYVFSLHDISRVVQGILLMSPRSNIRKLRTNKKGEKEDAKSKLLGRSSSLDSTHSRTLSVGSNTGKLEPGVAAPMMKVVAQLWCHECTRTFADRIISLEDNSWFNGVLEELAVKHFCLPRDDHKLEMPAIFEELTTNNNTPVLEAETPSDMEDDVLEHPKSVPEKSSTTKITHQIASHDNQSKDRLLVSAEPRGTEQTPSNSLSTSQNTSIPMSATAGERITVDFVGDSAEKGTDDETEADEMDAEEMHAEDLDSRAEVFSVVRDTPESHESESSEESLEESSNSDETETPITSSDSAKDTPEYLGSSWEADAWGKKDEPGMASQRSTLASTLGTVSVGGTASTLQPGMNLKQQSTRVGGTKRGVTFKAGLIADKEHEAYYGPLLAIDELKGAKNTVTEFLFSKYFLTCHAEMHGLPIDKGYTESTEDLLVEALHTCLNVYNEGTSQRLDLVFFSESVHHAARLSRVFAHPRGHALLLGVSYSTGRATLTRLAAYIAHCKLFEPKPQADPAHNYEVICQHIKRSCHHAGVDGKPTVLLLHEHLGPQFLQHASDLMTHGTSPGLYSEEEVQSIVGHMMPGGVQTKRIDKIEQAFQRFLKRVRQNLHIVICLNYKGNSYSSDFGMLHEKLQLYPGLLKHAFSIDLYQQWGFSAFSTVAQAWLEDHKSPVKVPWNAARRMEQIQLASNAMAYIHLSAKAAVERQFCHQREPLRFYSPLTFLEFVDLFKVIAAYTVKKEREKALKYEKALGKIDEAFGSIAEYKKEVSDLAPKHKTAGESVQSLVEHVEMQKQDYIQALEQCKAQEDKIIELQGPLDQLRMSAQSEFDKVNPVYLAAQKVLDSLSPQDIMEIKSYRAPPEPVKLLTNALCLMFGKPQTWEDGKSLMMNENFLQELIFYDKDHIPDDMFDALKFFVNHPLFEMEAMQSISAPAASLCSWVKAVHLYSSIYRTMQPHLKNLLDAENKFTRAQAQLGQLRVDAHRIKLALETTISEHKDALKEAKGIEKLIQGIERKIARANNLMENMSMQHFLWRLELRKARRHILAAPGDALITAACVCYHGPLDDKSRLELITDWLDRCRQGTFHAQAFQEHDPYSMIARLELLMEVSSQSGHQDDEIQSEQSHGGDSIHSDVSSALQSTPQVRTFKYMPAIYDTSKFYKSELKKTDTMESIQPDELEFEDSDDEDDMSALPTRSNFTLQDILSDFDELSEWRMHDLPTDLHSVQNALLMRVSCHNRRHCWPLLLDPDNQAEMWVKSLQTSRNIFTVTDVAAEEEFTGIPLEKVNHTADFEHDDSITAPDPPPSRGTALTFSDVTEYTLAESEYTVPSSMKNSQGRMSRQTSKSDELRPVTSVTNSWDTLSLHANSSISRPDINLWIVEADDPSISSKLVSAIVHGVTVLVTHLERRPLGSVFRGLLLKQFYVDHDGSKVVRVGDMQFKLHPNFRLYLSTTVPLFLKGDGLHSFPIHRMCIINMAVSDEAIINRLLSETMKVERKEFEGQRRSNESDIILHRQRLAQEHAAIREKTLNLDGPLLEDGTMLESLMACQSNVQRNRIILEETRFMGDHLQGKFAHYLPLVVEATVLYNILRRMTVLHPLYYLPFYKFVEIFAQVIKGRDRGKGSSGAPQARAQELSDAVTAAVFRHASMMMFEQHYNLLSLLFSVERLRISRKASHKELSLFVNAFEKQGLDEASMLEQKPVWMDKNAWIDCSILESLHHPLHGLCNSLVHNSDQWHEYFQHPIALLNPVPGSTLQELSIFQKCLLWKVCCPTRMAELTRAIVTYEMGSALIGADHYNIRDVYASADQYTPVVFVLPSEHNGPSGDATQGQPYVSPLHEVKRLAREMNMEGKVRVMNFGVRSQESEVRQALEDCVHSGNWLLLQNYHLANDPDPQFFIMLKDLVYARWGVEDLKCETAETNHEDHSLVTHSRPSTQLQHNRIHPTFRLWITTRADGQRVIPGILIQHGLRVTCEVTVNFHSTLQKAYRSAAFLLNKLHSADDESVEQQQCIMPLALFHALLLHQSYYGRLAFVHSHYWTLSDLAIAVEVFRLLAMPIHSATEVTDLMASVYSHHCADSMDANVVHAIVSDLAMQAVLSKQSVVTKGEKVVGVVQLLQRLLHAGGERHSLKRTLDAIEDTSARTFSLPDQAQYEQEIHKSRIILRDMVQVTGAPELLVQFSGTSEHIFQANLNASLKVIEPDEVVHQLLGMVSACMRPTVTDSQQIMPLDHFLHTELEGYRQILDQMQADLSLLQYYVRGELSLTPNLQVILETLCADCIPSTWLIKTFAPCRSVRHWVGSLNKRVCYVQDCYYKHPAYFWLPAFLRPDQLFSAVMQTHAKNSFKDITDIVLSYQVVHPGILPTNTQVDGIFVCGLNLSNASWDTNCESLSELLPGDTPLQKLPPLWIKPIVNGDQHQADQHMYKCPFFLCPDLELQQDSNVCAYIPVPTRHSSTLWAQKRVIISCSQPPFIDT